MHDRPGQKSPINFNQMSDIFQKISGKNKGYYIPILKMWLKTYEYSTKMLILKHDYSGINQ